MTNTIAILISLASAFIIVRALITGRIKTANRATEPLLFYTMICMYLLCCIITLVIGSGNLMTVINMTL